MKRIAASGIALLLNLVAGIASADPITDWNQTGVAVLKADNVKGDSWTHSMAMLHVAIADAVNAVEARHARYLWNGPIGVDASPEAAAASAAYHILIKLCPRQKQIIDGAFVTSLKTVPENDFTKREGIVLGKKIADVVYEKSLKPSM